MKIVFDDMDNFEKAPHSVEVVWDLIKEHFSVETRLDLLDHCYGNFQKPFFASLCAKMSVAAKNGDLLCLKIFTDAGRLLARSVIALMPNVKGDLIKSGELSVACVGSVWKSWDLLKAGFTQELNKVKIPYGISMKRLTEAMALGAVYLAADSIKYDDLKRDYTQNYVVFHCYNQKVAVNGNGVA